MNNQRNHARHDITWILALVGLIIAATLMSWPPRRASAQAVAPSWSYTGSLNTSRSYHTATLMTNGNVLVVGGDYDDSTNPTIIFPTAELYDPTTGTSSNTGNLNEGRRGHTATLLLNGNVLITGGSGSDATIPRPELFDPATRTWRNTGNLNTARSHYTAILLSNGKVLVAGGFTKCFPAPVNCLMSLNAELYDADAGTWSNTGNLNIGRDGHTATLLLNGKVLVVGGSSAERATLNSAELYDPATGTWSITGNLNTGRLPHTATLLPNGKVLVAGGTNFNFLKSAELYDPATGTWSITGNLNISRAESHTATLLLNGKVLIESLDCSSGNCLDRNSAELYDPSTGTWSITASPKAARGLPHTATLLPNGKVLVAGGSGDNTAELYDPGTSSTPNSIDDPQFFVRQHYRDFLNREPDPDGLAFWTNEINSCVGDVRCVETKRINVSAAYFLSIEFQQTGYLVYRMYKAAYGNLQNAPVPARLNEFTPDTQQIGQGVIVNQNGWEQKLENNKQDFALQFVQRSRFTSAYPTSLTPERFVDTLFENAGVTPTATDRANSIDEFGSATTTTDTAGRARALRRVAENSALAQQEFNKAFVLMQYFGYLRRNPNDSPEPGLDFSGYNFWLAKLNQFNGNFVQAEMVKAFLVSSEYRQRFGS